MQLSTLIFFIVFVSLLAGLDFYAFQGVRTLTGGWETGWARTLVSVLFWSMHIFLTAFSIFAFVYLRNKKGISGWPAVALNAFVIVNVTQLFFILILFGEDLYRSAAGVYSWISAGFQSAAEGEAHMPERRKFVSQMALLVASVPFAGFVYGVTRGKYRYTLHRHTVWFPDLPEAFDGFTITQISDLHAGSLDDPEAVAEGVEMICAQNSDLFVFTGDLVNHHAAEYEPWKALFSQIRAPWGQFSILGNHDYGDYGEWESAAAKAQNHAELHRHHAETGFRLLLDEHVTLEKDGQKICLAGVQNWGHGFRKTGNLNAALAGVPQDTFTILLSHDPSHFEHEVKDHTHPIHLTLSGHTHGMQMGVEFPWLKWSPVSLRYPRWAGLYDENGRKLYVNRGFGFLGFRGRVGIWPEITVLELRRGTAPLV